MHVIVVIFYFRSGIHRLPIPESQLQNHMPSVWPFPPPNYLLLTSNVLSGRSERNARLCGVIYLFSRPKITLINLLMQIVQHLNELFFFFFFLHSFEWRDADFFFFFFSPPSLTDGEQENISARFMAVFISFSALKRFVHRLLLFLQV